MTVISQISGRLFHIYLAEPAVISLVIGRILLLHTIVDCVLINNHATAAVLTYL